MQWAVEECSWIFRGEWASDKIADREQGVCVADHPRAAGNDRRSRHAVLGVALLAWFFIVSVWGTPWLERRWAAWGAASRGTGVLICHQKPERTLLWLGARQAVCARCAGLYLGGGLGLLAGLAFGLPEVRRRRWWMVGALLAPTAADVVAVTVGLPGLGNLSRLLAALPAGGIVGVLLAEGVADLAHPSGATDEILETS